MLTINETDSPDDGQNYDLVLASGSPRRSDILSQIGVRYIVVVPEIDESPRVGESGLEYVSRLAFEKANKVCQLEISDRPALGADTILVCDGQLFGKPSDFDAFREMITSLSGRKHSVLSAVAMSNRSNSGVLVSETSVTFRAISDQEILSYWQTGEPKDKAGGYAIQGYGSIFVKEILGSYSGVVGLPIAETYSLLNEFDVPIWQDSYGIPL